MLLFYELDLNIDGSMSLGKNLIKWDLKRMSLLSKFDDLVGGLNCVDSLNSISGDFNSKVKYWNLRILSKSLCLNDMVEMYSVIIMNIKN